MLTILSACNEYLLFDFSVAVHFLSWNVDHNHAKAKGCCWQSLLVVLPSSSLKIFTSSSCFSEAALVTGWGWWIDDLCISMYVYVWNILCLDPLLQTHDIHTSILSLIHCTSSCRIISTQSQCRLCSTGWCQSTPAVPLLPQCQPWMGWTGAARKLCHNSEANQCIPYVFLSNQPQPGMQFMSTGCLASVSHLDRRLNRNLPGSFLLEINITFYL